MIARSESLSPWRVNLVFLLSFNRFRSPETVIEYLRFKSSPLIAMRLRLHPGFALTPNRRTPPHGVGLLLDQRQGDPFRQQLTSPVICTSAIESISRRARNWLLFKEAAVVACGNVGIAQRFPREVGRVENLGLGFQAFHGAHFHRAVRQQEYR